MNFRTVNDRQDIPQTTEWQDENSDFARTWFRIQNNLFKISW